jgi:uncharacterized protein with PIN domain
MQEPEIRERLRQWRREHPQATFDEIDAEVSQQYARLHAEVVAELSTTGDAARAVRPMCPDCQQPMHRRGRRCRAVATRRGVEAELVRDYYVCPACGTGVFPPG